MAVILTVFGLAALGALAAAMIYHFADRHTVRWYVYPVVWFGWLCAFSILFLMPTDIESTFTQRCIDNLRVKYNNTGIAPPISSECPKSPLHVEPATLEVMWSIVYWSSFFLTWLICPLLQDYTLSGGFTFGHKLWHSIRTNLIFYGAVTVLFGAFMVYIMIAQQMSGKAVVGFALALANFWGLFLLICLLGNGLVELPRMLWRSANRNFMLRSCEFRATLVHEALDEAQGELIDVMDDVQSAEQSIASRSTLYPYLQRVLKKVPEEAQKRSTGGYKGRGEGMNLKELEEIHSALKKALFEVRGHNARWQRVVRQAQYLEDIIKAETSRDHRIIWTGASPRTHRFAHLHDKWEWYYRTVVESPLRRVLGVFAAVTSLLIVWCQSTIMINPPDLSVISQMIHAKGEAGFLLEVLVFFAVGYICICAYYSLFKIQLFSYYRMSKHNSDANSLLFNTAVVLRLVPAIGYNFLYMVHETHDPAFSKVMGDITAVPFFGGAALNEFFPLLVLLLCLATIFNVIPRLLHFFRISRFQFEDDWGEESIGQGRQLLDQEKRYRERGIHTNDLGHREFIGRSSRTTRGGRAPGAPRPSTARDIELSKMAKAGGAPSSSPTRTPALLEDDSTVTRQSLLNDDEPLAPYRAGASRGGGGGSSGGYGGKKKGGRRDTPPPKRGTKADIFGSGRL